VTAYQRALATVSNNIANVSTEGYSRQDVSITANQPTEAGGSYIGTGARFDQVRRQYDAFIESNLRSSNSDLTAQEPLLSYVNRLIDVMGNENIGLTTAMNQFFAAARDLASDPASTISRTTFLRDTEGLAGRFRQLSSQLEMLGTETRQSVETDIGQVNSLTQQLAELNKQLSKKAHVSDQPSELLDQRDLLLRELSGLIGIKTKFADNGAVLVSVGDTINQGILVRDDQSRAIVVEPSVKDPGKLQFTIDPYGKPEGLPAITSGKIGGVITFRDQVLSPSADSLNNLAQVIVQQVNAIHREGIDSEGKLGGDLLGFSSGQENTAGGMQVLIQDASRIAAAGQFRVIDDPLNPGSAQSRISYSAPTYEGPVGLAGKLANATAPQIGTATLPVAASMGYASVGLVSAGTKDLVLTLNNPSATQSLQVMTRDGRHLLGSSLSGSPILDRVLRTANGFEAGASYSTQQLNAGVRQVTGKAVDDRYLDMDLFIGAKAEVQKIQQFNTKTGALMPPTLAPAVLQGQGALDVSALMSAGKFTLNGVALPAADTTKVDPTDPNATIALTAAERIENWLGKINALNLGITASVDGQGQLKFTRSDSSSGDIRLGFGASGTPADLKQLGFNTSVFISGTSQDDLLVFVTDSSTAANAQTTVLSQASMTAQYAGQDEDMKQLLRKQSLEVKFSKDPNDGKLYYTISDTRTETELARRAYETTGSGAPSLRYRGITLEFTTQPVANDTFRVDGNNDGVGNNEAILKMVDLEKQKVMPGSLTMTEAYVERVNLVGSVARQASIAKDALAVVYQQAQQARDGVSGVSLDQEASELVRYQQAYQANAKVMQTATTLFDAILQIN
jgi:flagellar hook-associated protein FlgK